MAYASWSVIFGETPSASKWNILGTNDASFNDGTGIGNGAISSPQKLVTGAGTSWPWQAWSPVWTNLTVGAGGTNNGWYARIGNLVIVRTHFTFGSGSAVGAAAYTLPVTATTNGVTDRRTVLGNCCFDDVSGSDGYNGVLTQGTATLVYPRFWTNATPAVHVPLASTSPITWATGDHLITQGIYEAA